MSLDHFKVTKKFKKLKVRQIETIIDKKIYLDEDVSNGYYKDENDPDDERYLDDDESCGVYNDSEERACSHYVEVESDSEESWITYEEKYMDDDDEPDTDYDTRENCVLSAYEEDENMTEQDRTIDNEYHMVDDEPCDRRNDNCDGGENDADEEDTTEDEYYIAEHEIYTNQDDGEVFVGDEDEMHVEGEDNEVCVEGEVYKRDESTNLNISADFKKYHLHLFGVFERLRNKLILDFDLQKDVMEKAIHHLSFNFRNVVKGKIPTELNFNDMNNCVAYIRRFATCHAAVVYTVILQVLKYLPVQMSRVLTLSHQLSVVSVGSGPGNDLVGFLAAFHYQHLKLNHLDLTIIDKMTGWHYVFKQTVQILKEEDCIVGRVLREIPEITTSFFQADLEYSTLWCNGMISKLKNADILFLVKVLSNIPDANKFRILKDIVVRMKPGALLIVIDYPIPSEEFSALTSLKTIYKIEKKSFRLLRTIKKKDLYNISACTAAAHIFVKN